MLIAELMKDAFLNRFDVAYLVAGDNDYKVAIDAIRECGLEQDIVIALPPYSKAKALVASAKQHFFYIQEKNFKDSQLPDVLDLTGYVGLPHLDRPPKWGGKK